MLYFCYQLNRNNQTVERIEVFPTSELRDAYYESVTCGNFFLIQQYGTAEGEIWEDCFHVDADKRVQTGATQMDYQYP